MSYTHAHIEGSSSHVRQRTDQRISREHSRVSTRCRAGIMESSLQPFSLFPFFSLCFISPSLSLFFFFSFRLFFRVVGCFACRDFCG